ncbi:MAG: ubiquinol-cytochrome c reductase iron-sulfur subunit [Desulfosarcina sp.]|nr:ubiquinol-cytochrome c reductase iron-sulfur subunit [Desulfosarcina sp.]MBC2743840.1 ubiquinol-cytochrome c reductase iron-sulfur subunit [Desulfosarcina sp.]MBC2766749.1 ubiquinol-cytochrome c reductase iron-sulfur subunit [Desulfosarcina sp.]
MTSQKTQQSTESAQSPENNARRSLLNGLWLILSGLALAEIAWLIVSFLRPLKSKVSSGQHAAIIDAGPADRFIPNTVTAFPRGRFYLACLEDGGFLALSRRCTHLGCTVPWDPGKAQFACPCHASVFDIRGDVIQSPAPRALDRFIVSIENNRVIVDTSRPIQRSAFHKEQVVYK